MKFFFIDGGKSITCNNRRSQYRLYEIDLYVNCKLRSIPTYKYNNTTTIDLKYFKFKG